MLPFEPDVEVPAPRRAGPEAPLRSVKGLLQIALSGIGWLLLAPIVLVTQRPRFGASLLSLPIWLVMVLFAVVVSATVILAACLKRSFGVAAVSLLVAVAAVVVTLRQSSQVDNAAYQYRTHRVALAALAADYRAGRLHGDLELPPDLRPLCPSGFAYADATALFVQMRQSLRQDSGAGLGYFPVPPGATTSIPTAAESHGQPRRELGDGWWWVT